MAVTKKTDRKSSLVDATGTMLETSDNPDARLAAMAIRDARRVVDGNKARDRKAQTMTRKAKQTKAQTMTRKAKQTKAKPAAKPSPQPPAPKAKVLPAVAAAPRPTQIDGLSEKQLQLLNEWLMIREGGVDGDTAAKQVEGASYQTLYGYLKKARAAGRYLATAPKGDKPAPKPAQKKPATAKGKAKSHRQTKRQPARAPKLAELAAVGGMHGQASTLLEAAVVEMLVTKNAAAAEQIVRLTGCSLEVALDQVREAYRQTVEIELGK